MRAVSRTPARAARSVRHAPIAARAAPLARRVVARGYATQSGQGRKQTVAVPDNVAKNNGLKNAALWVREVLRRGPITSLKILLKMDELRWGRLVGEDQFGNKYVACIHVHSHALWSRLANWGRHLGIMRTPRITSMAARGGWSTAATSRTRRRFRPSGTAGCTTPQTSPWPCAPTTSRPSTSRPGCRTSPAPTSPTTRTTTRSTRATSPASAFRFASLSPTRTRLTCLVAREVATGAGTRICGV